MKASARSLSEYWTDFAGQRSASRLLCGRMSKTFRAWKIDEPLLLPPMVEDFVARGHLARFVLSLVRDDIALAEITGTYGSERGQPPFDPTMMTALLLYSYCCGIYSSRRISKACRERVDFMSIVALDALFKQLLQLCEQAGLVKLGHVALDGTKIKANASKHKAMSYERMEKRAAELEAEVAKWLSTAEAADAEEDKLHGHDQTGEEMPDWVADKKRRAERIRKAKVELEVEAKEAAEAKLRAEAKAEEKRDAEGRKKPGRKAAPPSAEPDAKAQKNFTDPDSRIMKSKDGFVQAYNAQAAVDAEAQIIVAHDVTQSAVDCGQLVPMTDAIETNLGRKAEQLSADAGYCSEANLEALENRNIDAYVATGRARDAVAGTRNGEVTTALLLPSPADVPTRVEAMHAKIRAGGHASPYRLRKQLPEPVFGQIKQARGFRQFLLRGIESVRAEWAIVCTVHNLLKLALAKLAKRRTLSAALSPALAAR